MTWRERIQAAREREQQWFWRRWRDQATCYAWPFTEDDREAWTHPATCLAGETADAYGIDWRNKHWRESDRLFELGNTWLRGAHLSARATERLLDSIEDEALALKRGFSEARSGAEAPRDGHDGPR